MYHLHRYQRLYQGESLYHAAYGIYGVGERCLHDEVVAFTKVTFEGKQYYAPGCYDQYLKQIFGDYMTLPPVEKRVDHKMKVWAEFDV